MCFPRLPLVSEVQFSRTVRDFSSHQVLTSTNYKLIHDNNHLTSIEMTGEVLVKSIFFIWWSSV